MKKIIAAVLAVIMMLTLANTVFAGNRESHVLKFDENGKFKIMHLCDVQDTYPMNQTTKEFLNEVLSEQKPDLVILGGDNTVCSGEVKAEGVKELCDIFVNNETYFTLVFGNHDHQQGVDKETLLRYYQQFGGEYCLAYDAVPELTGVGTHNLTVMNSDETKVAYNLYMMDSNTYYPEENNSLGYDAVHEDEIEWYRATSETLKAENGGEAVPAMMFQHIIVQEICDKLFIESAFSIGKGTQTFVDADGKEHYYTYLPKVTNLSNGLLFERPCPGYINYGQLDALVAVGDVKAIFSGHDHINNFSVNIDGVDVVNTAGCTYHSYGKDVNRGCRFIILDENDLSGYETCTYTIAEQALKEGSALTELGDITKAGATFAQIGTVLLDMLVKLCKILFFFVK